jgi:hypothetical protein
LHENKTPLRASTFNLLRLYLLRSAAVLVSFPSLLFTLKVRAREIPLKLTNFLILVTRTRHPIHIIRELNLLVIAPSREGDLADILWRTHQSQLSLSGQLALMSLLLDRLPVIAYRFKRFLSCYYLHFGFHRCLRLINLICILDFRHLFGLILYSQLSRGI